MSETPVFRASGAEVVFEGSVIKAGTERFRYADGEEVSRDKVWHPGAVAMIVADDECVWLVRQPREAAGLADALEIPAGKCDIAGEEPLAAAQRELAEELGLKANEWRELFGFYTSPGFCDEYIRLYEARDLVDLGAPDPDDDERIEIVRWPLAELDAAIAAAADAKTLMALLWLARRQDR
jgi:ADP-ribose pyrophosphatase